MHQMAVAQKTGTKMEPWEVEKWTKTCATPPSTSCLILSHTQTFVQLFEARYPFWG